jgi:hypothetical protein
MVEIKLNELGLCQQQSVCYINDSNRNEKPDATVVRVFNRGIEVAILILVVCPSEGTVLDKVMLLSPKDVHYEFHN